MIYLIIKKHLKINIINLQIAIKQINTQMKYLNIYSKD